MFSGKPARRHPAALSLAVMAVAIPAIFCTVALPAYAAQTAQSTADADAAAKLQHLKVAEAQDVQVSDDVAVAATSRDAISATSEAELKRAQLKAQLASVTYSGPSVRALLANPPYPSFSLDQVVAVAERYQGVPYVYGGASPAGFDCSGFTQFVYAQFGVALPHSAARQGAGGAQISAADARPGDIVAMDGGGHVGIYLGGNMMIDAPEPGKVVQIRAIYTSAHWFVRYGI